MKFNSKILGILLALLAVTIVISAVSAVDLVDDFNNDNFKINILSGTDFNQTVNIADGNMDLVLFENFGNNSDDVNSIMYLKDSTVNKTEIDDFIKDVEDNGEKVEETDKYVVLKYSPDSIDFDVGNAVDSIFNFVNIFSSGDGFNISADGSSFSLSDKGLEISDDGGENVSITSEGISVSGDESADNETVYVSSDIDVDSNIENSNYSIYLKNNDKNAVIVISGNNLELLKEMAETATFNEN